MTQEKIIDAITDLDSDILDRYFTMKNELASKKKPTKRTWVTWASLAAACFALVICAMPIMKMVFGGSHSAAPVSNTYNSIEEVHNVLGYDTLYSKLDLDESNTKRISISYDSINGDNGLEANLEEPLQLQIRATYPNGETTDSVDYYIIINAISVEDNIIVHAVGCLSIGIGSTNLQLQWFFKVCL